MQNVEAITINSTARGDERFDEVPNIKLDKVTYRTLFSFKNCVVYTVFATILMIQPYSAFQDVDAWREDVFHSGSGTIV